MTLVQLRYVLAVAEHLHFAEAAAASHVSQPTLSMQLRKLEDELGVTLFDRSKQPVEATDIGQRIISQARTVMREADLVFELARDLSQEPQGEFRLAVIPTLAPGLLPLFLDSFAREHPKVELIVEEVPTALMLRRLLADEIDAGLLATPVNTPGIHEEFLFNEPFVAYVSPRHPLHAQTEIRPGEIPLEDLWLLSEGHCLREQALSVCGTEYRHAQSRGDTHSVQGKTSDGTITAPAAHGRIRFESGTLATLRKLIQRGNGLTLLPWLEARDLQDKSLLRPLTLPRPIREISIATSRPYRRRPLIESLKSLISTLATQSLPQAEEQYLVEIPSFSVKKTEKAGATSSVEQ